MILLIGYGNTLRRDDGAGPALARMVAARGTREDLRVITAHQLVPELAEELAAPDVSAVLFMDACVAGDGDARENDQGRIEIREVPCAAPASSFGHHFSPSVLLAYARFLYGSCPPAWLITVPGYEFGFGEGFSDGTEHLLSLAIDEVTTILQKLA